MKKYIPAFVILIIISFYFCSNYAYLKKGVDYSGTDTVTHLTHKAEIQNGLNKVLPADIPAQEKGAEINNLLHLPGRWPPMVYLVSLLVSLIFGKGTFVAELSNILYVALLLSGVYLLGKKLSGRTSGLLAALITASFPAVSAWSRRYGLDLPLMSLTPWVMIALLGTESFARTRNSALFGLFLGLVILFKLQILLFVGVPLLYVLCSRSDTASFCVPRTHQLKNLGISVILAVLVASLWWDYHHLFLALKAFSNAVAYYDPDGIHLPPCPVFSREGFYYYLHDTQIGAFYLIPLLYALLHSFLSKGDKRARNILLAWIIFPYLLLSLRLYKHARWYYPSLPAIALFISSEISRLRLKRLKRWVIVALLLFGAGGLIRNGCRDYNNFRNYTTSADKILALAKAGAYYKSDTKFAFYIFDGDQITYPQSRLVNTRLQICAYAMKLAEPGITILNLSGDKWRADDADFVILLLDFTPDDLSRPTWQMEALKENILSEQELSRIFKVDKLGLRYKIARVGNPAEKKVRELFYAGKLASYLFMPRIRLYYVSQIKKGAMTIEDCARILKLPSHEIALWVDDYNRGGRGAIGSGHKKDFMAFSQYYTKYYTRQLDQALGPLLRHFTVVEKRLGNDYNVVLLRKKSGE